MEVAKRKHILMSTFPSAFFFNLDESKNLGSPLLIMSIIIDKSVAYNNNKLM